MFSTNRKKKYFQRMLKDVEKTIWEKEFSKYKALRMREDFRMKYDRAQEALARLKDAKSDEDKKSKEALEASVALLKQQLDMVDERIAGHAASAELPEGAIGIEQEIEGYVQLRDHIRAHIKFNC